MVFENLFGWTREANLEDFATISDASAGARSAGAVYTDTSSRSAIASSTANRAASTLASRRSTRSLVSEREKVLRLSKRGISRSPLI